MRIALRILFWASAIGLAVAIISFLFADPGANPHRSVPLGTLYNSAVLIIGEPGARILWVTCAMAFLVAAFFGDRRAFGRKSPNPRVETDALHSHARFTRTR